MSSVPEDPETEAIALIEKLRPAAPRDPQAAASGKSKFLAEARAYGATVSARREQRHRGWKENAMRLTRVPVLLLLIALIGVVVVFVSGRTLLQSRSLQSPASPNNVGVFVAGQNIPQGAVITEDNLATISVPQDKVSAVELTVDEKSQLVGKVARFPLDQGVVITRSMVADNNQVVMAGPPWSTSNPQHGSPAPTPQLTAAAGAPVAPGAGYSGQMVIKNGEIRLLVKDTDRALDGVTQVMIDTQGYVISSRVWYQAYSGTNYKYATLTMGVPVDQFENALRRLRSLAVQVVDENATGQDVTDQYVDLQSQLTNLQATRDRIKSFLAQAKSVDEALQINQQLSEVEAQIEKIQGQMNYLSNRSAFSTITIDLEPELPTIVATQTPMPTATPTPSLGAWNAGETTRQATYTLVSAYRLLADFLIWFFLVIVPIFGPAAVLIWLVAWLIRRRSSALGKGQGASGLPTNR